MAESHKEAPSAQFVYDLIVELVEPWLFLFVPKGAGQRSHDRIVLHAVHVNVLKNDIKCVENLVTVFQHGQQQHSEGTLDHPEFVLVLKSFADFPVDGTCLLELMNAPQANGSYVHVLEYLLFDLFSECPAIVIGCPTLLLNCLIPLFL